MRAILLIVLLHLAIAQQSEEEVDRRVSRLEARIQQLEQAAQLAAQQAPAREDRMKSSAMLGDRMAAMEGRMTAQMTSILERMTSPQEQNQSCDIASSIVRGFNQLHPERLDRDARAVESQLREMRELVQSAVGDVSATEERIAASNTATEERIASANLATEERLASNVVRQIENMTSLITELAQGTTAGAPAMESQLLEMRQIVQSAVDHLSATEERIAASNEAMEERLTSNHVNLTNSITSQIADLTERMTTLEKELENRTTVDCKDLLNKGFSRNGVYTISSPDGGTMQVYCDMENDGGGWTVFQRRMDGSQDFLLGWQRYAAGFGNLTGEFWLGNRNLNFLTGLRPHELKITLMDWEGQTRYAHYDAFSVGAEADKFPLTLGDYSGDAGDNMAYNNGRRFSTVDQDNDHYSGDCASTFESGWWHGVCTYANLNGLYLRGSYSGSSRGVFWAHWRGWRYSLKHTEMKMRRL